jgi:peptidoglycan hydrolase-like protein with peptidoglycan-binding domain
MQRRTGKCAGLGLLVALTFSLCASPATTKNAKSRPASASSRSKRRTSKTGTKGVRRGSRGQKVPTPERIAEIQQALAKDGSFTGTANGKWDSSTTEAVKRFQDAHGLNPTGKLDALTLQKLGLGSQTAGVAAPTLSSSSVLSSPRPSVRNE